MSGGAGKEDAEASAGRNQIGDGWGTGLQEEEAGMVGPKGQARCGGFPLPEGVSRAAGPLDGDPMALGSSWFDRTRAQISVTQTLSVLCSLDKKIGSAL